MKKFFTLIFLALSLSAIAQTATDANGNKVYNGSIAIFTRLHKYSFSSAVDMSIAVPTDLEEGIKVGAQAMAVSAARVQGIQVVNRDDAIFKAAQSWIEESKNEEYMDGLAVRARKIGASHILIQDIRIYQYGNAYMCYETLRNLVSVQTNQSDKFITKHWLRITDPNTVSDMVEKEKRLLRKYFMDAFPAFFALQKYSGNTVSLGCTSYFGFDVNDEVCFYEWDNVKAPIQGQMMDFSRMKLKAVGTISANPKIVDGFLQLKINNKLTSTDNLVIKLGDALHSEVNTYFHTHVAVVEFKTTGNKMEDFCKIQINNAVYNALYDYALINIIESDDLSIIKKERELQKSEDFIDGTMVEQIKACGASEILSLSDFSQHNQVVNFKMSLVDVDNGAVEKDFLINCHISNIDEVIKYYINKFYVTPLAIGSFSKKQITVHPTGPIASSIGEPFTLFYNKPMKNPMTGETIYNRVPLAKCVLTEWNCQEYVLTINEILDKDDFEKLSSIKDTDLFYLGKDLPEPIDVMKDNTFKNIESH